MYFKQLEMYGFKSFAEKTRIDFEPGITAIVGPNGVGKSNISDSIKWVLGTQSAKEMRGSKMEDVIFNGTDDKEPLGFTEVSLTLSNESKFLPIEYDEVIISRRLYRSGESEYLVNKTPVRLKDINDLLAGSGLGVEAYSMVEQGKIGMILSSNPEERRYIFEEASGIIRYKVKKREALRRLEATETNLVRVNDIITEVKRQISSIERQAKKAERYKEYFQRLQELDTRHARHTYDQLKKAELNFENHQNGLSQKEEELNAKIIEETAWVEDLKSKLAAQDSKILEMQSKSMNLEFSIKSDRDTVRLDKERIQELVQFEESAREEITLLRERVEKLSRKSEELNSQFLSISNAKNEKQNLLRQKEEELSELQKKISETQVNIKEAKTRTVDVLAEQSKTKNEITKVAGDIQNNEARLRRLTLEGQKVNRESAAIEKNMEEANALAEEVSSKIEKLSREKERLDYILEKDRTEFSQLDSKIRDCQNEFHSLQSKLRFLEDLVKKHEGFSGGTKALLTDISDGRLAIEGLEKPIAELIEVRKGYETAVEAALGRNLEAIVVSGWDAALRAITYLKEKRLGRAGFINKSAGKRRFLDIAIPAHPAILGRLTDFVKAESRYEAVIENLLDNAILVNDLDSALEIAKTRELSPDIKLVTPTGQVIRDNMVVGGNVSSEDSSASLIGRQARIEETHLERERILDETVILKKKQNEKKESITNTESALARVIEALRHEEIDLAAKNSRKLDLEREFKKINEELSLINLEIEETTENTNVLTAKEASLRERLKGVEEDYSFIQNIIADSQTFINEGSRKREELLVGAAQLKTELSSLAKEEDNLRESLESQNAYLEEQKKALETRNLSLSGATDKAKELTERIGELEKRIETLLSERAALEQSFKGLKETRENLLSLMQKCEKDLKNHENELSSTKDRIHNLQMEKAQLSFKIENLKNRITNDYKTDLDNLSVEDGDKVDWNAVESEIALYKDKLDRMGPVSLVAIQEYEELKERMSFLTRQEDDLAGAKESLLKAIKKINQTTRELFMDTFNKVQVEFRNYFRYLFGGGKADIVLVDPNDVLESDIEIIVRPPGKKLQNVSLLSGGEKALAAMSLMFAIFKVKPSPFCLLDEVDAPLDDSNINRFSKILGDFAKTTQFIIITHNKKTIALADIMYGITMSESGVSKVVSVKFAEEKEEKVLV